MQGGHESTSPQLISGYFLNGPATQTRSAPLNATALGGFGQMFTAAGHAASNTRVQLRNFETYVLSRASGTWKRVQYSAGIYGAYYSAGYAGAATACSSGGDVTSCIRSEASGGVSVKPQDGKLFRFWPESGVTQSLITASDIEAVFTTVQARLIKDAVAGADDKAAARLLVNTASDWWTSAVVPSGTNFTGNAQVGNGKLHLALAEWQAMNFHSAVNATQVDALATPLAGGSAPIANSAPLNVPAAQRVVLIGDSITQGNADQDSFRRPLWNGIVSDPAHPLVEFVGSRTGTNVGSGNCAGPVPNATGGYQIPEFDLHHEAFWGWCVQNVTGRLATVLPTFASPDVAIVHLGTNDLNQEGQTGAQIAGELTSLVATLRARNPAIHILLAQLIPMNTADGVKNAEIDVINSQIVAQVQPLSTGTSPITIVDQNTGFLVGDLRDAFHPNDSGEAEMAARWLPALKSALQ